MQISVNLAPFKQQSGKDILHDLKKKWNIFRELEVGKYFWQVCFELTTGRLN